MPQMILMRHAKSDWETGLPDHERPLNARGRGGATALGDWLRAQDLIPDQALVSSAARTQETWERLALDAPITPIATLYLASPAEILKTLQFATGQRVLILGHNPGIAEFADHMLASRPDHPKFTDYPTGATLVAQFNTPWKNTKPGTSRALQFVVPRDLM